jgi:hypothetical protein
MSTDREQLIREALKVILNANTGLRTVCGRTTALGIERLAFVVDTLLPVAVVDVFEVNHGNNEVLVLVDGVASGVTGGKTAREVCEAAAAALTWSAFSAQGLELVAKAVTRESVMPDDPFHLGVTRAGDPTLHQARATIPLLYVD